MKKTVRTTCTLDCQDACGVLVRVEEGRPTRLLGDPDHPYTRGFLCHRLNRFLDRFQSPDRITRPLKREDGAWKPVSWDEALDLAARKIREVIDAHGPLAILCYQGNGSFGISKQFNVRLFNRLGGATVATGSLCLAAGSRGAELSAGNSAYHPPKDILNSRCILLWGKDPAGTMVHMVPLLQEAAAGGAQILLIDPVKTRSARLACEHYMPRPGSDAFLAAGIAKAMLERDLADLESLDGRCDQAEAYLSLIRATPKERICERTDMSWEQISRIAAAYGTRKPASILPGKGVQHYRNGVEIMRHLYSLAALSGNLGVPGGGVSFAASPWEPFDLDLKGFALAQDARAAPKPVIGECIRSYTDPPLKMAWVMGGNPVGQTADAARVAEAFRSLDFVVVADLFLSDTAACAHLFLPCTTFLEEEDLRSSGWQEYVGKVRRAVDPVGEAKPDWEIMGLLAERLGIEDEYLGKPVETLLEGATSTFRRRGIPFEAFEEGPVAVPGRTQVAASSGFQFVTSLTDPLRGTAEFPLQLLALKNPKWQHSQIPLEEQRGRPRAFVHPDAARARGLRENDPVVLISPRGRMEARVALERGQRPDCVVVHEGGWLRLGRNPNVLSAPAMSEGAEGACYYDTWVRLERG
ncbi:MAG: molybdopterin-dependent oxidoreductase [Candidatus Tectomicrobia bacterium]|nr:molybdopterin-dependent oxidoreductase [Candidatus Tectomicrobia bacterium]